MRTIGFEMTRLGKLFRNSIFGLLAFTVHIVASLILLRFLNSQLGLEIVGLNALLVSAIAGLAVVDIGLTTAIEFALYKPLNEKNYEQVALLVRYFRGVYLTIGAIMVAIALAIFPFIPMITQNEFTHLQVLPAFAIFLTQTFLSYFFAYNHKLLFADQKQFISSIVASCGRIVTSGLQILILLTVPLSSLNTFYLVLGVMLFVSIGFNVGITVFVKKRYPFLGKYKGKPAPELLEPTKQNMLAFAFHRIGDVALVGKDALIVSALLGTVVAGYLANYMQLVTSMNLLAIAIFSGVVATFGNLLATESKETVYQKYKKVKFLNFFFFVIVTTAIFILSRDFLYAAILPPEASEQAIFHQVVMGFLAANMFLFGYSSILRHFRVSAGAYNPDKWFQLLFVAIGIGLSVGLGFALRPLGDMWGILGVLIGTTVAWILRDIVVLPIISKKHIHGGKRREYYKRFGIDFAVAVVTVTLVGVIYHFLRMAIENIALRMLTGIALSLIIPIAIMGLVYHKTEEFIYLRGIFKRLFGKKENVGEVIQESVDEMVGEVEFSESKTEAAEDIIDV